MSKRVTLHGWLLALTIAGLVTWAEPGRSQSCPSEYSACENGGCCPSSGQCCTTLAEGCCSSFAPYCCGDGTCAASPGQCGAVGGQPTCPGYAVPCGDGCAPAGADCCDPTGNYCDPESKCESATTCSIGGVIEPTRVVTPREVLAPDANQPHVISPIDDPSDASERSCSFGGATPVGSSQSGPRLLVTALVVGSAWLGRRRRQRPVTPPRA